MGQENDMGLGSGTGVCDLQQSAASRCDARERTVKAFSRSEPDCWEYIAEGSLNVVCRYVGSDCDLAGYALRVRKKRTKPEGCSDKDLQERFIENQVVPLIGKEYVNTPIGVILPMGFVKRLGQRIEQMRPTSRKNYAIDSCCNSALLLLDNTHLCHGDGATLSFEIKPKKGFLPVSHFVENEVKKQTDFFTMDQHFKYKRQEVPEVSKYCPLDLFAQSLPRMKSALRALIDTPQNNFRMFADGKLVYPVNSDGKGNPKTFKALLDSFFVNDYIEEGPDVIIDALTQILIEEPLLDRIKMVQMLDDCDIESTFPLWKSRSENGDMINEFDYSGLPPRIREIPLKPPIEQSRAEQDETLRRYLIARTAKDCSIMLTIRHKGSEKSKCSNKNFCAKCKNSNSQNKTGRPPRVRTIGNFVYSLAVVDLDSKPSTRFEYWYERDSKVTNFYTDLKNRGLV